MALPTWVPEIETKPAPMPLLLVQSFVNTYEADTGVDVLADREGGRAWLAEAGLLRRDTVNDQELAGARAVRESLRALLVQNAGGDPPAPAQRAILTGLARTTELRPVVEDNGTIDLVAHDSGGAIALGTLLLIVRDAQRDGSWGRLKACRNDECLWVFFDRSHAGRGAWCDMAICGNRIKNRKLRARRTGSDAG